MRHINFYRLVLLFGLLCSIVLAAQVWAQPVAGRVIGGVSIDESDEKIAVDVHFNFPIRYLSHFPDESGRELRIRLQPISVSGEDLNALSKRESYNPSTANITEIIYEGDSHSGLFLSVFFNARTSFSVSQGTDFRSLRILVSPKARHGSYAINLESTRTQVDLETVPPNELFQQYTLYTSMQEIDGQVWHRLRLGLFPTEKAANAILQQVLGQYPQAWVTKTSQSDIDASTGPSSEPPPSKTVPQKMALKSLSEERKQALLEEAKKAMANEDYRRAVQIYTRLIETGDDKYIQQALEFLGLARERNNQLAHARAEYEKYLTLYPTGKGAERVKQRLAGVLTARAEPKGKLRSAKTADRLEWQTDVYGSLSQFYDRDESYTNNEDTVVNRSSLFTDVDLNARFRNDDYDIRANFVGGYENDFLDNDESEERISSLYLDILSHKLDLSTRIGRQSRSTGGILGRFDGALVSWQAFEKVGVNLVAGYPVSFSSDITPDTSRPLYGINFDLGTFADRWDFNTFYITQDVDGIIDREAVGGEVRYFRPGFSFFALADYDISYNQLNTVLMNANWSVTNQTTLNIAADYRQSPLLMTNNALQGQTATSIDELIQNFTESEVRQLAEDRTATSRSYTLGVTHSFNSKLQLNANVTVSELSGTPSSGGVEGFDGTGYDSFYLLQLIGSSLIKEGDIAIVGLRYSNTSTAETYSINLDTRYPITRSLRFNPRVLVDYRKADDRRYEQLKFRPLVRLEYRWKQRYNFEVEGGFEFLSDKTSTTTVDRRGFFLTIGYRIDF